MVIGQKYLLKEDHHTVAAVHPGNKWKPVESLKVPSIIAGRTGREKMGEGGGDAARKTG